MSVFCLHQQLAPAIVHTLLSHDNTREYGQRLRDELHYQVEFYRRRRVRYH